MSHIVLITGASSGFGRSCAEYLSNKGFTVFGTSRNPKEQPDSYTLLPMDVHQEASVTQAVQMILDREGRLDAVVNNAGSGIAGAIEDSSIEEFKAQFETNFFGVIRMCQAVLPVMRKQRFGKIINISSIGGLISVPFQGAYCASKFALEGMTEALRLEVKPFGIYAVLIEPGDFKTGFTDSRVLTQASRKPSDYTENFRKALKVMEEEERNGEDPRHLAPLLERVILHPSPNLRYTIGPMEQRLVVHLKKVTPPKLFEWIIKTNFKLR